MSAPPPASSCPSASVGWYYLVPSDSSVQQLGPFDQQTISQLIQINQITSTTYGWNSSLSEWIPLSTIPQFMQLFKQQTAITNNNNNTNTSTSTPDATPSTSISTSTSISSSSSTSPTSTSTSTSTCTDPTLIWYYVDKYRSRTGPISLSTLLQLYQNLQINDATMVWKHGMTDWLRICEIPELSSQLSQFTTDEQTIDSTVETKSHAPANSTTTTTPTPAPTATATATKPDSELTPEQLLERQRKREKKKRQQQKKKQQQWKENIHHANLYAQGLPLDVTLDEAYEFFRKGGIIKEDEHGNKKIKLYTNTDGTLKGDALIYYAMPESIPLAIELLDGNQIRVGYPVHVSKAHFTPKDALSKVNSSISKETSREEHFRKKQKLAAELSWDEDGIGIRENRRIVILKPMFTLQEAEGDDNFYSDLKIEVGMEIEQTIGKIEKITVFEGNHEGPIAIKFHQAEDATKCCELMSGRYFGGHLLRCDYWDGKTNYKVQESEQQQQQRLQQFGEWIEQKQ